MSESWLLFKLKKKGRNRLIPDLDPPDCRSSASTDSYVLGSYRIATTLEPNSSRLMSFKSTRFDSPANNERTKGLMTFMRAL